MARDTETQATCTVQRVAVKADATYIILRKDAPVTHPILGDIYVSCVVTAANASVTQGQQINVADLQGVNLNWR